MRLGLVTGFPWVATVSGFVVLSAETTGWKRTSDGATAFVLKPPGPWSDLVEQRWWPFGRGRHWCLWDPWRLTQ